MSLGTRLKKEREKRNWSQIYVGKKIGITNAVLSNYERDYRDPDTETLKKLAELYGVSIDYLLGRTDNPKYNYDNFNLITEHNRLLESYGLEESGLFDIENWKQIGPEEIKQLESYFRFIVEQAKKKNEGNHHD